MGEENGSRRRTGARSRKQGGKTCKRGNNGRLKWLKGKEAIEGRQGANTGVPQAISGVGQEQGKAIEGKFGSPKVAGSDTAMECLVKVGCGHEERGGRGGLEEGGEVGNAQAPEGQEAGA